MPTTGTGIIIGPIVLEWWMLSAGGTDPASGHFADPGRPWFQGGRHLQAGCLPFLIRCA